MIYIFEVRDCIKEWVETADNKNNQWQSDSLCENELVQDADGLGLLIEDIDPGKKTTGYWKAIQADWEPLSPLPIIGFESDLNFEPSKKFPLGPPFAEFWKLWGSIARQQVNSGRRNFTC